MKVDGKQYRTVWMEGAKVFMIDQTQLPFDFKVFTAHQYRDCCFAIKTMITRGAGAIGATAGFAMAQAFLEARESNDESIIQEARSEIEATRPTAQNLFYTVNEVYEAGKNSIEQAVRKAHELADENVEEALQIGKYGNDLIDSGQRIMTHCNAGWLGFVDWGSALSPIYVARNQGKKVFIYVSETRPRNQGARLTAWELKNENIPHAIIPDSASAYYMSRGETDMIITGADRVAANGDVANKIGTLEKAIVAHRFGIPFYVAVPLSTFDPDSKTGDDIVIEQRDESEVLFQEGPDASGKTTKVWVCNPGSEILNPAFDITPAGLITGLITSKGIINPAKGEIKKILG